MRIEHFAGTHVGGTLKLSEAALNGLLAAAGSPLPGARIAIGADNDVVLHYGMLSARATLPQAFEVGAAPRVTLRLASFVVALAVSAAVRVPYVRVDGREVTILLRDVPALDQLRELWPHLARAGFRTEPRTLVLNFTVSVTE